MVGKGTNMRQWVEIVIFPLVSLGSVLHAWLGKVFPLRRAVGKLFTEVLFPFLVWILKTYYDPASRKKLTETIPGVCDTGCVGCGHVFWELFVSHFHIANEIMKLMCNLVLQKLRNSSCYAVVCVCVVWQMVKRIVSTFHKAMQNPLKFLRALCYN